MTLSRPRCLLLITHYHHTWQMQCQKSINRTLSSARFRDSIQKATVNLLNGKQWAIPPYLELIMQLSVEMDQVGQPAIEQKNVLNRQLSCPRLSGSDLSWGGLFQLFQCHGQIYLHRSCQAQMATSWHMQIMQSWIRQVNLLQVLHLFYLKDNRFSLYFMENGQKWT